MNTTILKSGGDTLILPSIGVIRLRAQLSKGKSVNEIKENEISKACDWLTTHEGRPDFYGSYSDNIRALWSWVSDIYPEEEGSGGFGSLFKYGYFPF